MPITLTEALRTRVSYLPLPPKYKWLGGVPRRFRMMIWGPSRSRKSTLLLQLADQFTRFGVTAIAMGEENPVSGALLRRAAYSRINNPKILLERSKSIDDVRRLIVEHGVEFMCIDSVNSFAPLAKTQDFIDLAEEFESSVSFIFIYQVLANERMPRDGALMQHFCDIRISMKDGRAFVEKNRLGDEGGMGEVK